MSVELKEKPEGKTKGQEEQLTDGFHLLIDALKMNDLNTIYGVPGIPITDFGRMAQANGIRVLSFSCLLYTSPSPRDKRQSRMPSSA